MVELGASGWHYPPDLTDLPIDTIPRLVRSKRDVLLFFRHVGVGGNILSDLDAKLCQDRESINKFEITRTVLQRLNEREGNEALRCRREIVRRVVEWEDFSTTYPEQQAEARGFVAEVQRIVNVKDSFTRISLERDQERRERLAQEAAIQEQRNRKTQEIERIRREIAALITQNESPKQRGERLESLMNRLFRVYGISVRDSFKRTGEEGEGVIEQVDGVIDFEGDLYLVELKWLTRPADVNDVSRHLVRVFGRNSARGIFISASDYTKAAISICRESLSQATVVLVGLDEIILALEREADLVTIFRNKVRAAVIDKNPWIRSITSI